MLFFSHHAPLGFGGAFLEGKAPPRKNFPTNSQKTKKKTQNFFSPWGDFYNNKWPFF